MKTLTVVGTRPQLIKCAALQPLMRQLFDDVFVDTGQHYDEAMARVFFEELRLPTPKYALGIGSGSAGHQVAAVIRGVTDVIAKEEPDVVVVYGDTNSTLGGALAGAAAGVAVAHVEAGLRSGDRAMPEEINRKVADHLSRALYAPNDEAVANLASEGIVDGVVRVGDVLRDLCAATVASMKRTADYGEVAVEAVGHGRVVCRPGCYVVATLHRKENRESRALGQCIAVLRRIATGRRPVVFLAHPGTLSVLRALDIDIGPDVILAQPVGYRTMLSIVIHAAAIVTDSGGLQREAGWIGTPCLVLRDVTEWDSADVDGRVALVGRHPDRAAGALARMAPLAGSVADAEQRARTVSIATDGAAEAIVAHLATLEPRRT
jgi:UDP-N-acetylglucosamine 2-epimerase